LVGRGRAVDVAHDLLADGVVRHLVGDVGPGPVLLQQGVKGGDIGRPGPAVAGDDGGDALREVGQVLPGRAGLNGPVVGVGVQVDAPGGDDQAGAVDHFGSAGDG